MAVITQEKLAEFFDMTRQTIAKWKQQEDSKPAIRFAYKYLDDEKIEEFLKTGEIEEFDKNVLLEISSLQEFLLEKKALDVYEHFKDIEDPMFQIIFGDFVEKTKYKVPIKDINDFVKNVDFVKNDFYEKFTTFLCENKNKYEVYDRRNAHSFVDFVLSKEELYLYYSLKFIEMLEPYKMQEFDTKVERYGFLRVVVNTFFKQKK